MAERVSLRSALMLEGGGIVSLVGAGGKTSLMFRLARELAAAGETVLTTTTTRIVMPGPDQSREVVIGEAAPQIVDRCRAALAAGRHVTAAARLLEDGRKLKGLEPKTVETLWQSGLFRWVIVEADGAAGRPLKAPAPHEPVIPSASGWVVAVVGLSILGKPLDERWVFRAGTFAQLTGLAPQARVDAAAVAAALVHPEGILRGAPEGCRRIVFLNQADTLSDIGPAFGIGDVLERERSHGIRRVVIGQIAFEVPVTAVRELTSVHP